MRWIVVAHPDDELIFSGGALLSHPGDPWTVVVATHPESSPRAAEALAARGALRQRGLQVDYRFLGHSDEQWHPFGGIDPKRLRSQLSALGVAAGERVYTHGHPGEYGHQGHKIVFKCALSELAPPARLSTFSGAGEVMERITDPGLLAEKAALFRQAYPSQQGVWTGLADTMREVMREERHLAWSGTG